MNKKIDQYLSNGCGRCPFGSTPDCKVHNWNAALNVLRQIALENGLHEELKWGVPCYTFDGKNICLVSAFKYFCALSFFKGVLLDDPNALLNKPGKHSQSSMRVEFKSLSEVKEKIEDLNILIQNAIKVEQSGQKVEFKANPEPLPDELKEKMRVDPVFREAFESLTPGRQRGYILHFSQPKNSSTRVSRINKWEPTILKGDGMHDAYKRSKK